MELITVASNSTKQNHIIKTLKTVGLLLSNKAELYKWILRRKNKEMIIVSSRLTLTKKHYNTVINIRKNIFSMLFNFAIFKNGGNRENQFPRNKCK